MNKFLANDIFSIIQKLTSEEKETIRSLYKKKKTGKEEKEYLKLFESYCSSVKDDDDEPNIDLLKKKFPKLNDTNQNLKKKLLEFIETEYRKKQYESETIEKLKNKILLGKALMEKRLFSLAEEEIKPAFHLAKELYSKLSNDYYQRNAISGYLAELFYLLFEIQINNDNGNLWETEKEFQENFIQPIVQFAYAHYNETSRNNMPGGINNQDWQQYAYNEVLRIFYRKKERYDKIINLKENKVSNFISYKDPSLDLSDAYAVFVDFPDYLFHFEKMYACLKTRNYSDFEWTFNEVKNSISLNNNANNLYSLFIIFCHKELYRIAFIYSNNQQKWKELLIELNKTTKEQLHLFPQEEIKNVALTFTINDAITKFLIEDYSGFINIIQDQEIQEKLKKYPKYYFPLKTLLLFAYQIGRIKSKLEFREKLEKEITKYFKNSNEEFYLKLLPFLKESYWQTSKTIDKKKIEQLENSANELDHFHQILLKVIKRYAKPNN